MFNTNPIKEHLLITGPPGSGKTTLVGETIRDRTTPAALVWGYIPHPMPYVTTHGRGEFLANTTHATKHLITAARQVLDYRRNAPAVKVSELVVVLDDPMHAWADCVFNDNVSLLLRWGRSHDIRVITTATDPTKIPHDMLAQFGEHTNLETPHHRKAGRS